MGSPYFKFLPPEQQLKAPPVSVAPAAKSDDTGEVIWDKPRDPDKKTAPSDAVDPTATFGALVVEG